MDENPYTAPITEGPPPGSSFSPNVSNRTTVYALACLWVGISVVTLGTHLKTQTPQFDAYLNYVTKQMSDANPEEDLAPGMGIGLMMMHTWPILCGLLILAATFFTGGLFIVRAMAAWRHGATLAILVLFVLGCAYFAMVSFAGAIEDLQWGFLVAAAGWLLVGAAFVLSAIAATLSRLTNRPT
jgi:hypothetical protein